MARLYLEQVEPEAFHLLDREAVREASAKALLVKLEPRFRASEGHAQLPELQSLPAQWGEYVEGQDLVGFDRDRIRTWATTTWPGRSSRRPTDDCD